ncbi:pyruvate decarboxylase-like protein [Phyllosticta capitalensis]|uniref:Pyruvate decarboxylase n=1 Tax=Phyllosticta capitalensis TaxID=121624 RepID=A0ABR1Z236_9PEZI
MSTIPLGRYLWERIHQVGVNTIIGVPGDFNLDFLDYIYDVEGLRFVGSANELNGAYAADGYSRVKSVPGVMVTTHGVGELSALNGIAGAHSEQVKVIHVVGQTNRAMQDNHMLIHHSIDSEQPDHSVYSKMSKLARVDEAQLWDVKEAPAQIDRVIRTCFLKSRPVYIFLPLDLSAEHVPADLLKKPLDISPPVDAKAQDEAVSAVIEALSAAKNPAIFVDILTQRHNAVQETRAFVNKLKVPIYASNMAKGVIDDTDPNFVGILNGKWAFPGVFEAISKADFVLVLGDLPGDTNSGFFSRGFDESRTARINVFDVNVKGKKYDGTFIKPLLAKLAESVPAGWKSQAVMPKLPTLEETPDHPAHQVKKFPENQITQQWMWDKIMGFVRSGDVVLGETGTSLFGIADAKCPVPNVRFQTQTYYGSIGWATPATLGAELAQQEMATEKKAQGEMDPKAARGRTILLTGDGSMNLTMQEVGTMIKNGTRPIIFVLNNSGYTIERVIHGAHQTYNDINPASYQYMLPLFQHPSPSTCYRRVASKQELMNALADPELADPKHLQLVEIVLDKLDCPWRLLEIIKARPGKTEELKAEGFLDKN